jgi:hypothetical protein
MTFGTAGDVDFGTEYSVSDLDFNVAGKITITGSVDQGDQNGFLIRLLENGSMDAGFGNGGETILPIDSTNEYFSDLLCASGKIYSAGSSSTSITGNVLVARFNDDLGTLAEDISQVKISVMPNPATTVCFIRSGENINEIRVISSDGKLCLSSANINKPETALNLSGINPGMYFMQIVQEKSPVTRKLLVIE